MPAGVSVLLVISVVALMGLYAGLRPEKYAQYFLAKWQRERLSGQFNKTLSWTGWAIFAGSVAAALFVVLRPSIRSYADLLEVVGLLAFAIAWLWWGSSLLLRPDAFVARLRTRLSPWVVRLFGAVLLLGAAHFGYQFAMRVWALLR
jgi:hypothetical protein